MKIFIAHRIGQVAHIQFVSHSGTPHEHKEKSDGVPKALRAKLTDHPAAQVLKTHALPIMRETREKR
jgi:hypothetical protein